MELSKEEKKTFSIKDYYRENLSKVFKHYLAEVIENKKDSSVDILSVGCGLGYEAEPLLRIFPNAIYTGIDIDSDVIHGAGKTNKDLYGRYQFQTLDARDKDAFGSKPWDIVILRNPQVGGSNFDTSKKSTSKDDWYKIIINSLEALVKGGTLFISVDEEHERDMVLRHINSFSNNISIVVDEPNKYPSRKGIFRDKLIIMAKKIGET